MTAATEHQVDQREAARKRFARLQALAALRGHAVERIDADDGGAEFVVSRWALTRRCGSLDELAELLQRMGVAE